MPNAGTLNANGGRMADLVDIMENQRPDAEFVATDSERDRIAALLGVPAEQWDGVLGGGWNWPSRQSILDIQLKHMLNLN